ncbi:MAG: DUF6362 family protein [Rhodospirillales bacterium]
MNTVPAQPYRVDLSPDTVDGPFVIYRLEEAGTTLLALPGGGYSPRLRMAHLDVVHTAAEMYGWEGGRIRPATPTAERISRMDEALGWITLIPKNRYVLRRIVGARSLVSPVTERHFVFVATAGDGTGCGSQGGATLARTGDRYDCCRGGGVATWVQDANLNGIPSYVMIGSRGEAAASPFPRTGPSAPT